ncbi:MAG: 50S ribosomal protein L16 [Candidatus Dojkabacteria bacterium]|jgi:large subunit ribosomal protein L16
MLQPKKRKHPKEFRGKMKGVATVNNKVTFGEYGLKSIECGWINAREIEAARRAVSNYTKRKGKVWIKIFPHKSYTQRAINSKMQGGKGAVEGYVAVVLPGTMLLEIGGLDETTCKEALRLAGHKFSVKTKFVSRQEI